MANKLSVINGLFAAILCSLAFGSASAQDNACISPEIGGPVDWKPYLWIENGERVGPMVDQVKQILDTAGINARFTPVQPWKRVLRYFEDHEQSILFGALYTKERAEKYRLSDPFMHEIYSFVRHKDNQALTLAKIYDGKLIAAYRGTGRIDAIKKIMTSTSRLVELDTGEQLMKVLLARRVDAALVPRVPFQHVAEQNGVLHEFEEIHTIDTRSPLHFLIHKNNPCFDLMAKINQAITSQTTQHSLNKSRE